MKNSKQEKQLQNAFVKKRAQREQKKTTDTFVWLSSQEKLENSTDSFMHKYDEKESKKIEGEIVMHLRSQEYRTFLENILEISELRMELVELLIEQNKLEHAKKLCRAMIEKGMFKRNQEWLQKLLHMAGLGADLPAQREMLIELLRVRHDLAYFDQLKELVPRED